MEDEEKEEVEISTKSRKSSQVKEKRIDILNAKVMDTITMCTYLETVSTRECSQACCC